MKSTKILVTGSKGQLGQSLATSTSFDFQFTDVEDLDITNKQALIHFFEKEKPSFCINAAAYTAVDKAEEEKELATKINAEAVGNLASICQQFACHLLHVSTDFVFDGKAHRPYQEEAETNPISVYGHTKREGELLALKAYPQSVIIRTSWLYSSFEKNFVRTMLRLAKSKSEISVVSDQVGTPTYALDLTEALLSLIQRIQEGDTVQGIYHFSNEGVASWYDFAQAIFSIKNIKTVVRPIATEEYPTPAKRPNYSVLDKRKIRSLLPPVRHWREALEDCLSNF